MTRLSLVPHVVLAPPVSGHLLVCRVVVHLRPPHPHWTLSCTRAGPSLSRSPCAQHLDGHQWLAPSTCSVNPRVGEEASKASRAGAPAAWPVLLSRSNLSGVRGSSLTCVKLASSPRWARGCRWARVGGQASVSGFVPQSFHGGGWRLGATASRSLGKGQGWPQLWDPGVPASCWEWLWGAQAPPQQESSWAGADLLLSSLVHQAGALLWLVLKPPAGGATCPLEERWEPRPRPARPHLGRPHVLPGL